MTSYYQDNLKAIYAAVQWLRLRLEAQIAPAEIPPSPLAPAPDLPQTLTQLSQSFRLTPFESHILLLCLGTEVEPSIAQLCAQVQGNPQLAYPTLSLANSLFPDAHWQVLSPHSALQMWSLVEFVPQTIFTQAPLKLDRRVLCYLLGEPATDPELRGYVAPFTPRPSHLVLPPSHAAIAQQAIAAWSSGQYPLLQLWGLDSAARYGLAHTITQHLGFQLQTLSAAALPQSPGEIYHLHQRWLREALLSNAALLLDTSDLPAPTSHQHNAIALFLKGFNLPVILCGEQRLGFGDRHSLTFDLQSLPHQEKRQLWEQHLGERAHELNGHLEGIIAQFNLGTDAIRAACETVQHLASEDLPAQLWQYCRTQARPELEHLAQRIDCTATWDDLVLPSREKSVLMTIATQVKHRAKVYETWGFASKSGRGLGISTLFAGASGTGKTMAAEVLAREFKLDLYRIDLSAVSSKYIGDTEKNLRKIFDAAESGGSVLLFDEADALFGKRTQVKDSHDRHANLEVSYLLQRMEAYQGLAILTTNLKDSLDQAFLRRLRFIINFPYPKKDARSKIWARIFPTQAPTQNLDYEQLGQLDVAGGNIRSIALNAAFLAAEAQEPVMMQHILQAAQAECLKLGRSLSREEVADWVD